MSRLTLQSVIANPMLEKWMPGSRSRSDSKVDTPAFLPAETLNQLEHRIERLHQSWWHDGKAALGETPRRGSRHPVAASLRQASDSVEWRCTKTAHESASSDQRECLLLAYSSM